MKECKVEMFKNKMLRRNTKFSEKVIPSIDFSVVKKAEANNQEDKT